MFEDWPAAAQPSVRRVVEPARPVLVDLSRILVNPGDAFRLDEVAMGVKCEGLDFTGVAPGHLHAWARSARGGWLAFVEFEVMTANRKGKLAFRQWCPAAALTPRATDR